ncbi:glycosyltransferase family 1 protein [Conidiobolus coronatus NRRL 28638]|uniref:Glycosyltransferase family 1 protein n=1 Tax=Conidiobolus coronatus (strain ATCC 28846 / CBS 209.66 / NRRL 28638) TaxID=796925 RepID=A0A137PCL9_CONC2|nr:glycosyltransferase family 1 protein [Conidiobolus coronatus NRRL 28638]|eukprot:KXN72691.1 glycosyltransferase family 1 protein [Conidiobolus coronatus NRRL 28638]
MNLIKYFLISLVTAGEKEEFSKHIDKPVNVLISQYAGSRSHVKFLLEIANELSGKGHKVTYATPEQKLHFGKGYNVNMYNMGSIQYEGWSDHFSINYLPPLYDQFFPTYETLIEHTKPDVVICDFFSAACVDYCQIHQIPYIVGMQALNPKSNPIPYINDNVSINIPVTTERMSFWNQRSLMIYALNMEFLTEWAILEILKHHTKC